MSILTTSKKSLVSMAFGAAALLGVMAAPAQASLIGDTISCEITPTPFWVCDNPTAVVGAGAEFELDIPQSPTDFGFLVDVGAESVRLSSNEDNIFGLGANEFLTLSDLDWVGMIGEIVGIENFSFGGVTGMDSSDISFSEHSVMIDLHDTEWSPDSFIYFDLQTRHRVPEPGVLGLIGLGLAGFMIARRRRQ